MDMAMARADEDKTTVIDLPTVKTAADARAEIARLDVPIGEFARLIGIHHSYFGQVLHERVPMGRQMLKRITVGLQVAQQKAEAERPKAAPVPRIRRLR